MPGHISSLGERARRLKRELDRAHLSAAHLEGVSLRWPFDRRRFHLVPHALHSMVREGFQPHPFQLATLSAQTGVHFEHWLSMFGYLPDLVPRWQLKLHVARTVPISTDLHRCFQRLWSSVHSRYAPQRSAPIADLDATPSNSLRARAHGHLYLKVGRDDRLVPSLFPAGSIVRVDTTQAPTSRSSPGDVFAVEHLHGISVCPVALVGHQHVQLIGETPPLFRWRLQLGREAVILGRVDCVLRSLDGTMQAQPLRRQSRRQPLVSVLSTRAPLHVYVAAARERAGLTFPAALALARRMAAECGHEYRLAGGTLARYEALDRIPRHIPKLLTLASVYALDLERYLIAAGMVIPLTFRTMEGWSELSAAEVLRDCLRAALDRSEISLGDIYWFGTQDHTWHPFLIPGASILVLDRRQRQPRQTLRLVPSDSRLPLFLVQRADGSFDAGPCSLEGNQVVFHPCTPLPGAGRRMSAADTDVVGRIVAVLQIPGARISL